MNAEPPVITSTYWWMLRTGEAMMAWGLALLLVSFAVFLSVMTWMLALMILPLAGVLLVIGVVRARNSLASGLRLCSGFGLLLLGFMALGVAAFLGTLLSAKAGGHTPQSISPTELARFAGSCVVPVLLISPGLRLWTDWTRGRLIGWCVLILAFPFAALVLHGFLVAIGFLSLTS